jgi:hypothetical protein
MSYIKFLVLGAIKLTKDEDKLVWSRNLGNGEYTAKLSYEACMEEERHEEEKWWWALLWKM